MSNIINCIKENVYNSKVIVINNVLGLIVNDKEIEDGVYRGRDWIIYRWERGTISNDPPATIIGLEVPPSMILENILFQVL